VLFCVFLQMFARNLLGKPGLRSECFVPIQYCQADSCKVFRREGFNVHWAVDHAAMYMKDFYEESAAAVRKNSRTPMPRMAWDRLDMASVMVRSKRSQKEMGGGEREATDRPTDRRAQISLAPFESLLTLLIVESWMKKAIFNLYHGNSPPLLLECRWNAVTHYYIFVSSILFPKFIVRSFFGVARVVSKMLPSCDIINGIHLKLNKQQELKKKLEFAKKQK